MWTPRLIGLLLLSVVVADFAIAEICDAKLRMTAPYESARQQADELVRSDASIDAKLLGIAQFEEMDLNCRELVHAALMRITVYRQFELYPEAISEAEALYHAEPLPALHRHFTHLLLNLLLENQDLRSAETYIDYLVESRPVGFEGTPLRQEQLVRYIDLYARVEAFEKAAGLVSELGITQPLRGHSRTENDIQSIQKVARVLIAAGQESLAASIDAGNFVLWIDACGNKYFDLAVPMGCGGVNKRIGDLLESK